jgi:hypothetical protein
VANDLADANHVGDAMVRNEATIAISFQAPGNYRAHCWREPRKACGNAGRNAAGRRSKVMVGECSFDHHVHIDTGHQTFSHADSVLYATAYRGDRRVPAQPGVDDG